MGKESRAGPTGAIVGMCSSAGYTDGPSAPQKSRIEENRSCQDVLFLIVFVAFWVGMIINSSYGINKGDPRRCSEGISPDVDESHAESPPVKSGFDVFFSCGAQQINIRFGLQGECLWG